MITLRSHRLSVLVAIGAMGLFGSSPAPAAARASSRSNTGRGFEIYPEPTAAKFWAVNGKAIVASTQNGQCTEWAIKERPDIFRRGVEAIVAREIARHQPLAIGNWDADHWVRNARLAKLPVGKTPRVGAIVVFQPGVQGAGPFGHVAYVTAVNPDGSFSVSEMHAPVLFQVTTETFTAGVAQLPGIKFIS